MSDLTLSWVLSIRFNVWMPQLCSRRHTSTWEWSSVVQVELTSFFCLPNLTSPSKWTKQTTQFNWHFFQFSGSSCHNNSCYYFISILWIVELNPYAAHVYFNRANLYASLRKYKDSEDDYTRGKSQPHLPPLPSRVPLSFHLTWYGAVLPLESNWKLERSVVVQAVIKC